MQQKGGEGFVVEKDASKARKEYILIREEEVLVRKGCENIDVSSAFIHMGQMKFMSRRTRF